jgi:hypothetical protein
MDMAPMPSSNGRAKKLGRMEYYPWLKWVRRGLIVIGLFVLSWGGTWVVATHVHLSVPTWAWWTIAAIVLLALLMWRGPWLYRQGSNLPAGVQWVIAALVILAVLLWGGTWVIKHHIVPRAFHRTHVFIDHLFKSTPKPVLAKAPVTPQAPPPRQTVPLARVIPPKAEHPVAKAQSAPAAKANAPAPPQKVVTPPLRRAQGRHPPYLAFCPNGAKPLVLARKVEEAWKADSTGRTKLAGCHANIVQFIEAFNQGDPDAHITGVPSLLKYLRNDLVLTTVPHDVKFYSSCLYGRSSGPEDVFLKCDPQIIPANSPVYANKHTGRPVFKVKCANPGIVPVKPLPPPPKPPCVTISFNARVGGWVKPDIGPVKPSVCNAQKQGNGPWVAWHGECTSCGYMYRVTDERQTFRFDRSVVETEVSFCRLSEHRTVSSCKVRVLPEHWKGRSHIDISDSFWRLDDGNCPE